ncbi:PREDICTED: spermatogenesis-associated protein 1 [Nanorana parkeri]|uniref:spermatogenesis-associated protein 1 n=1 Tax=Nanorana parkeri TaxID=125878 RepID=UPI000854B692|nr:PREDICTED: spermatogenesis-associated protein 1 [Nanorana parkeri]
MDSYQVQTPMSQTRPSTAGLIELHAYLVPEELWNPKLNKVSIDVIWRFVSLGFIRVPPDMRLRTLRENLAELLGEDVVTDKFVFLKCVGSSLALVKARQEPELKLKAFAPPYAREPELYLLPGASNEDSTYGSTVTPDQHHYHTEYTGSDHSVTTVTAPTWDKPALQPAENTVTSPPPPQEDHVRRSYIWNRKGREIVPISNQMQYNVQIDNSILPPIDLGKISNAPNKRSEAANYDDTKKLSGRNTTGDSGIEHSLLRGETDRSHRKRPQAEPTHYKPPPSPPLLPDFPTIEPPKSQMPARDGTVLEQLNRERAERIQLEKLREELIKRTKALLEQQKLRRQRARDSWKKKYFETKKVTSALEETLNKLKKDLEVYYQKLLGQLAARDSKKRAKHPTLAADSKNSIIMKITTKQHDLDELKRKLENARIKLLIEIKMRKQASLDLDVLKAELAQKKAQSGLSNPPLYSV